ncbi:hypothetical protein [Thaumasiovibrio sp. DFM-14]|uniref:hypothetical protein n=1 Tax=Thaumasiovibrio sp. DFM-14 TaxID=3384792 RepID=UPI0039A1CD1D
MLSYLAKHSALFLLLAAIIGFLFPSLSAAVFPSLPYILFFLMLFTLAGMQQSDVLHCLKQPQTWTYALTHNVVITLLLVCIGKWLGINSQLLLALAAIGATGSLFATPAIVRSIGLNPIPSMATTIATTLLMPLVLYVCLTILQANAFHLDLIEYLKRLCLFIALPMISSVLLYRFVPKASLQRCHKQLSQVTIILVFSFPLGLIGEYRQVFDYQPSYAITLMLIACILCVSFFSLLLAFYWPQGKDAALTAAITSGNRNVLLTWTVAGPFLGSEYLALIGALQLPIYMQPIIVKKLHALMK